MNATPAFDLEAELRDLAAWREITDAVHCYMRGLDPLCSAVHFMMMLGSIAG